MARITDAQVRKLMEEITKHGKVGLAAMKSGMDRKTARGYIKSGELPSAREQSRHWRTREDPFEDVWDRVAEMLVNAPGLEAKAIFEYLNLLAERDEGQPSFPEGQLRTFQRRIRRWRAQEGPEKVVFFPQAHVPGEALQTDFTHGTELGITIAGESFAHLLCHCCLPYSNWQSVRVCGSESLLALRRGIQAALFKLGRVPRWSQTDNSTAATHRLHDATPLQRGFNDKYIDLVEHFGMKARTTAVGAKEQNGDIEAANGALKRRLKQHLLLRGSRNFETVAAYESWIGAIVDRANFLREVKVQEELAAMRPLVVSRLLEYDSNDVTVSKYSTIRILKNSYSVPSRLIRESVEVRVYEDRLAIYFAGRFEFAVERLLGRNGHRIDYRHIIWSLVKKPGAFARYKFREDLFPSLVFRKAYDSLSEGRAGRTADLEYLRLLHLAAANLEADVEVAIQLFLDEGELPTPVKVAALVTDKKPEIPTVKIPKVDLSVFDTLLSGAGL